MFFKYVSVVFGTNERSYFQVQIKELDFVLLRGVSFCYEGSGHVTFRLYCSVYSPV